jgi:hypothetical protein
MTMKTMSTMIMMPINKVLGTVQMVRYAPIFWRKLLPLSSGNKNEMSGKNNSI